MKIAAVVASTCAVSVSAFAPAAPHGVRSTSALSASDIEFAEVGGEPWDPIGLGQLGKNNTDNLGDGANEMGSNLTTIDLGTNRTALKLSTGVQSTCALLDNNTVKCWGRNDYGQLGQGSTDNLGDGASEMGDSLSAIDLGTNRTAQDIEQGCLGTNRTALEVTAGLNHTCVRLDNNTVKCWGLSDYGQLGQGNTNTLGDGANELGDNLTAVDLGTNRTAIEITAGKEFSCARLDNSDVKCWGRSDYGQLGQGNTTTKGDGFCARARSTATQQ